MNVCGIAQRVVQEAIVVAERGNHEVGCAFGERITEATQAEWQRIVTLGAVRVCHARHGEEQHRVASIQHRSVDDAHVAYVSPLATGPALAHDVCADLVQRAGETGLRDDRVDRRAGQAHRSMFSRVNQ